MTKIGVLGVEDGIYNETWNIDTFSYKSIREHIIDFKQVTMDNSTIFDLIGKYLKPNEHSMLNITDLLYNENYVFQSIYKTTNDAKCPNLNELGEQLTRGHKVDGSMILIKRRIGDTNNSYVDFAFDDLFKIVRSTFVHNALIIHPSDLVENLPFINDVLESKPDKQTFETIRYHEYKFLDYTMIFYCDISADQTDKNLNKIASTIYRKKIYGIVFVTLVDNNDESPQFLDLSQDTLKEIYHLHGIEQVVDHTLYAKKFDMNDHDNFPQINYDPNFFSIVHTEYNLKKNINLKTDPNIFIDVLNNIK